MSDDKKIPDQPEDRYLCPDCPCARDKVTGLVAESVRMALQVRILRSGLEQVVRWDRVSGGGRIAQTALNGAASADGRTIDQTPQCAEPEGES